MPEQTLSLIHILLGQEEQITPYEALRAVTINAAYQYFEEKEKGSLAPGKRAELVILDRDQMCIRDRSISRTKMGLNTM